MSSRWLPVRPDLTQLKHQAKELLRALRRGDAAAVAELGAHHPKPPSPEAAKLADAQLTLARSYGVSSWPRLVLACRMTGALWRDDRREVVALLDAHPELLHEPARGAPSNWGAPMSYAANLGHEALVTLLRERGATDVQHAFERAALQGQLATARRLLALGAQLRRGVVMGPCETLNADGLGLLLSLGAELCDEAGDVRAPLGLLLQTYSRFPEGKHACFELLAARGVEWPATAPFAVHRGRIDLLEPLVAADSSLLHRTFSHRDFYPLELGCSEDESLALHGTPLDGGTLLHLAVDFDELEVARWLLARGADVDARARFDGAGFGGHTALFGCVVSQPFRCGRQIDGAFAELLLAHGADPRARASLRKRLRFVDDETEHVYRDVTPLEWGRRFHDSLWVNLAVIRRLELCV